ncbi:hypothetical protein WAH83_22890, partial [Acinetobacter baumannii]
KRITGIAVPAAKNIGNQYPLLDDKDRGISVPKNKTNMVGQNAKEKINPIKNEPTSFFLLKARIGTCKEKELLIFIILTNMSPINI